MKNAEGQSHVSNFDMLTLKAYKHVSIYKYMYTFVTFFCASDNLNFLTPATAWRRPYHERKLIIHYSYFFSTLLYSLRFLLYAHLNILLFICFVNVLEISFFNGYGCNSVTLVNNAFRALWWASISFFDCWRQLLRRQQDVFCTYLPLLLAPCQTLASTTQMGISTLWLLLLCT